MQLDKRETYRLPLSFYMNEYIDERPQRCMTLNVGPGGLFVRRLQLPTAAAHLTCHPHPDKLVGLEFELPGTAEVIWAAAKVRFDCRQKYFHQTGLAFTAMAEMHRRLVRDYVIEHRQAQLEGLLARVRRNRRNADGG